MRQPTRSDGLMKLCKHCDPPQYKPATPEYFSRRSKSPDGLANKCKACESRDHKAYYADRQKNERRRHLHRKSNYKLLYNITIEDYDRMFKEQNGACKICKRKEVKLVVDHDHSTGFARGLLCDACNHGLGRFRDNIHLLISAVRYLEDSNARQQYNQTPEGEGQELRRGSSTDGTRLGGVEEALRRAFGKKS